IVNVSGESILRDLEVVSQTDLRNSSLKLRKYDIEKANEIFKNVGRKGEELINEFLQHKLDINEIQSYTWSNKDGESGLPFDFTIQNLFGNIIYLDVKTTNYSFDQKMIFSDREIEFISGLKYEYHIYRIFGLSDNKQLKICEDCKTYIASIYNAINNFEISLVPLSAELKTAKLAISPQNTTLKFLKGIAL
ncbi:MAG: DUF3883 domain-containing protein, partial [Firmicutes bacterium]|nr:DUF3883 domain-containing protein [Bacillota bacterium]